MDEPQGKARQARGNRAIRDSFREEYHAPQPCEHEATGTPFSEADREQIKVWQCEIELINQLGVENLCSKN